MRNVPTEHTRSNQRLQPINHLKRLSRSLHLPSTNTETCISTGTDTSIAVNIVIAGVLCIGLGTSTNIDTGIA